MKKVVAHFKGGRVLKGTSLDVAPGRPTCHIRPQEGTAEEVRLADLKALFFVRSLEGDSTRDEGTTPDPKDPRARGSTVVRLTFEDGETMVGLSNAYPPTRDYFFIVPIDAGSNNHRILINRGAVVGMEQVE